jgi:hypothetical protein
MPRSTPACCIAALLFMAGAAASAAETPEVPRHLALARELVQNIEPGDNQYILGGETITFPGDAGSSRYAMKADCSGFALALFARSGYSIRTQMQFLVDTPRRRRPRAEDFVLSIEEERGFKRIFHVADVRPGDIYAHAALGPSCLATLVLAAPGLAGELPRACAARADECARPPLTCVARPPKNRQA